MFLRCAADMLVANNTLYDIDGFVFSIGMDSSNFSGSIAGLRVVNNIISVTGTGAKVFGLTTALPSSVVIDHNLARTSGVYASLPDGRSTSDPATFHAWTGYQQHEVSASPGVRRWQRPRLPAEEHLARHRCGHPCVRHHRHLGRRRPRPRPLRATSPSDPPWEGRDRRRSLPAGDTDSPIVMDNPVPSWLDTAAERSRPGPRPGPWATRRAQPRCGDPEHRIADVPLPARPQVMGTTQPPYPVGTASQGSAARCPGHRVAGASLRPLASRS